MSLVALLFLAVIAPVSSAAQAPGADVQIASAILAAPGPQRAGATILGFLESGEVKVLREGDNDLVCLADNPIEDGFSVACYHESLEPYMARGRELVRQGVTESNERLQRRWREAEAGELSMPEEPATLYILTGTGYDAVSESVIDPYLRYVVYTPWATVESTGLPNAPMGPGGPWLMFPGTAGAHIMISPPRGTSGGKRSPG